MTINVRKISGFLGRCTLIPLGIAFIGVIVLFPVMGTVFVLTFVNQTLEERGWKFHERVIPMMLAVATQLSASSYLLYRMF